MSAQKMTNEQILKYVQSKQIRKDIPEFRSGDTIIVHNKIIENNKSRIQKFEGVVIRRRGSGLSETIIVRKESSGIGVERIFQLHSPQIEKIEVIRLGKVRRAYLTYLRERSGKSARIKERRPAKAVEKTSKPASAKKPAAKANKK
ncbi:50S ribosomal protein L19 [Malacoplasma penetrans]|uniref:Large ribosomal subunit protein bL19 n=1 Tax=Malacoplasma penetrans (strain HF-2) TaxID=272633 RepID=RL19_MALP2|nr:50S ribosomal protein L19 [Malacoplasma penetrans]Q8EWU9.1 RecName: Full=Large ribosomal subunit protein bL19; AltName: Full=50S ribosomal protein L19 [Malacoplasma penetrans HF-2]BAC43894.1 ribosomal protein L19 [Malacoplasma penetrans HF-2]